MGLSLSFDPLNYVDSKLDNQYLRLYTYGARICHHISAQSQELKIAKDDCHRARSILVKAMAESCPMIYQGSKGRHRDLYYKSDEEARKALLLQWMLLMWKA